MASLKPFITLLGAKSSTKPLASIPQELSQLKEIFEQQAKPPVASMFEIDYEPYFTQHHLKSKLNQLQDQIAILHFAGHSSAEGVLIDDELVYSRHIAGHMASWNIPPALVVLNGCENAQQVAVFHEAGVSVVIATHRAIDDELAAGFAQAFYTALLEHPRSTTLQQAFEQASSNALMGENRDAITLRSLNSEDEDESENENEAWDWDLFPQDKAQLSWTFQSLLSTARPVLDENGELYNPYKGLEAFQEKDQSWFYGRESVTEELLHILVPDDGQKSSPRLFSLLGASGSGKSSLINAGLIPRLRDERPTALVLQARPGNNALQGLAEPIVSVLYPEVTQFSQRQSSRQALTELLGNNKTALPSFIQDLLNTLKDDKNQTNYQQVFLFIDQFEELFTHAKYATVQHYLALLIALIESKVPCTLVIIMRADFLAAALAHPPLAQHLDNALDKKLSPLSETELRTAVVRPAQRQQVTLENGLVENLLNDLEFL